MADGSNAFQSRISSNYASAKAYYSQRRTNLNKMLRLQMENAENELVQYINRKIDEYDENVSQMVYNLLEKVDKNAYKVTATTMQKIQDGHYDVSVENVIKRLASGKTDLKSNQNVAAALGNEFESFIERMLSPDALEEGVSEVLYSAIVDSMSSFKQTGGYQSKSFVTKGIKNIRPDIGLNMDFSIKDKDGILRTHPGGLEVELQEEFNLDDFLPNDINSSDILRRYLESSSYGFSLKIWKDSQGKEFSSSTTLQDRINAKFQEGRKRRKTWESTFTNEYVVYQVSKLLINIIGPMNVALLSGKEMIWMDDFLSQRIFYMDVQLESVRESKRGPGYEGFPLIPNASVKIRNLKNQEYAFGSRLNSKTGRISVVNRKVVRK